MRPRCYIFKTIQILLIGFLFYSYAMFQGGAVSYTLFYAVSVVLLYLFIVMVYPVKKIQADVLVDKAEFEAGGDIRVKVKVKRPMPLPLMFLTVTLSLPDTLGRSFTGIHAFLNNEWPKRHLLMSRTILLGFKKEVIATFDIDDIPRGEHAIQAIDVTLEDVFLFSKKAARLDVSETINSYPVLLSFDQQHLFHLFQSMTKKLNPYQKSREDIAGVREYVSGDKLSQIDWKRSSKQAALFTKQFDPKPEERVMFYLDIRSSVEKNEWALTVLYSLIRLFDSQKRPYHVNLQSVGGPIFDESSSPKQKQHILSQVNSTRESTQTTHFKSAVTPVVLSSRSLHDLPDPLLFQLKQMKGLLVLTTESEWPGNDLDVYHLTPDRLLRSDADER